LPPPAACPDTAPGEVSGEVSGHDHPKLRLALAGRTVSRPCFLHDSRRLLLPAFGAYTGGLSADSPALAALLAPDARAILTGEPCVALPLAPALARAVR
jgi:metallophosphoesterase superfamily enzyme